MGTLPIWGVMASGSVPGKVETRSSVTGGKGRGGFHWSRGSHVFAFAWRRTIEQQGWMDGWGYMHACMHLSWRGKKRNRS